MNRLAKYKNPLILTVILAGGLWLRLKGFTLPAIEEETLYLIQVLYLKHAFVEAFQTISQPVLFFLGGNLGRVLFGDTLLALRGVALLYGLGTMIFGWLTARRLSGDDDGLWAAFLMAVSFLLAGFSWYYRPFAVHLFSTIFLAWALLWVLERLSIGRIAVLIGLSLVSIFAAYTALFVQGGLTLALIWTWYREPVKTRELNLAVGAYLAYLVIALALFFVPGLNTLVIPPGAKFVTDYYNQPGYSFYWADRGFVGGLVFLAANIKRTLVDFLPFTGQAWTADLFLSLTVFVAFIGLSSLLNSERGRLFAVLILGTCLAHLAAMAVSLWDLNYRHFYYLAPLYLVVVARGVVVLGGWLKRERLFPALIVGLLILALLPLRAILKTPMDEFPTEYGYQPFISRLKQEVQDGDGVFMDTLSASQYVFTYAPDRLDLVRRLYTQMRRYFPAKLSPLPAEGRWEKMFGKRVFVVFGGEDIAPFAQERPRRLWVRVGSRCHSGEGYGRSIPKKIGRLYRPASQVWRAPKPLKGMWALYELRD